MKHFFMLDKKQETNGADVLIHKLDYVLLHNNEFTQVEREIIIEILEDHKDHIENHL